MGCSIWVNGKEEGKKEMGYTRIWLAQGKPYAVGGEHSLQAAQPTCLLTRRSERPRERLI